MSDVVTSKAKTPQPEHAEFCELQFARDLIRLVREWKLAGKPEKR